MQEPLMLTLKVGASRIQEGFNKSYNEIERYYERSTSIFKLNET